jgi:hypothetical protein
MSVPSFRADKQFGSANERQCLPIFSQFFNTTLHKTVDDFDPLDYCDVPKTTFIELKSRRIKHNDYETCLIGANKVAKCEENLRANPNTKHYFCYSYTDGLYYIEYNPEQFSNFKRNMYQRGERSDINDNPKETIFIPTTLLQPIRI